MVSSSVELVKVAIKAETLTTVGTGYIQKESSLQMPTLHDVEIL